MLNARQSIVRSLARQALLQGNRTAPTLCNRLESQTATAWRHQTRSFSYTARSPWKASTSLLASGSAGSTELKRTPLYDLHVQNGGTLVDFGGYEMPLEYKEMGIKDTALWTRSKATIFDVSHM
jgi:aminomethyltransferase